MRTILVMLTMAILSGCAEDTSQPGNAPDVAICGEWAQAEQNWCGGIWARSCTLDGRKCLQVWDCNQRYWDCQ